MDNGACSYRRYLEGDESAARDIMDGLFFGLVFFVDRYVHDTQAAEDIALDVMSDLFVYKHRYNFKVSLKTYLYMVAKSRALDHLRRVGREKINDLSEAESLPDDNELEEKVLTNERSRIVNAALSKLPHDMRIAVHLVFFENMSYDEAAKVMKKNRKQIDNLLYRAKKELSVILGEEGSGLYEKY